VFFPSPEPPERFGGKNAVRNHFQKVFDAIRSNAPSGPPYHRLISQDLEVQLLGPDAAIVSFHLRNSERLAGKTSRQSHLRARSEGRPDWGGYASKYCSRLVLPSSRQGNQQYLSHR
jgi:hypothetical protein